MKRWAAALLVAASCAVVAEAPAAPERPTDARFGYVPLERAAAASSGASAAVTALIDAAERELAAARPGQALPPLERALGIEPHNATLWHYLGRVHLELGNYAQAEAMAAKSRALAGGNRTLRTHNASLAAAALRAQGKSVPPQRGSSLLAARAERDARFEEATVYVDRAARAWTRRPPPSAESTREPTVRTPSATWQSRATERAEESRRQRAAPYVDCRGAAPRQQTSRCSAQSEQAERRASSSAAEQRSRQRAERRFTRRYNIGI